MSNPFNSRCIQPGAQPFIFDGAVTSKSLIEKASQSGKCYLIVGPHGTGKSTLLYELADAIQRDPPAVADACPSNQPMRLLWLRPSDRPNWTLLASMPSWKKGERILIDGFEQLYTPIRALVKWFIKIRQSICIATSHELYQGYELLYQTDMNVEVEHQVVATLLANESAEAVTRLMQSNAWKESRAKHSANLRESLFDMYDWWQTEFPLSTRGVSKEQHH